MMHDDGCCPLCGQPKRQQRAHTFGDVTVADGEIRKGGMSMVLTPVRFAIVEALAARANKPVALESLMQVVYGDSDDPPTERVLDVHLSHLRRMIGAGAIETRFGGFRIFRPDKVALNPDALGGDPVERHNAWTREHEATLRDMFDRGESDEAIAKALNRGVSGVTARRLRLGLAKPRQHDFWKADEDAVLTLTPSNRQAAAATGRTVIAVKIRRAYLRRKSA